jgi:hypothetical protein
MKPNPFGQALERTTVCPKGRVALAKSVETAQLREPTGQPEAATTTAPTEAERQSFLDDTLAQFEDA